MSRTSATTCTDSSSSVANSIVLGGVNASGTINYGGGDFTATSIAKGTSALAANFNWQAGTLHVGAFGTPATRLSALEADIVRMRARLARPNPSPLGPLPLMIGCGGERVTLRIAARYADMWNGFGPLDTFTRKNGVLNNWCGSVGRDPDAIERTVLLNPGRDLDIVDAFVEAGARHLIVPVRAPFDLGDVERVLARRDA